MRFRVVFAGQKKLHRLHDVKIGGLFTFENAAGMDTDLARRSAEHVARYCLES